MGKTVLGINIHTEVFSRVCVLPKGRSRGMLRQHSPGYGEGKKNHVGWGTTLLNDSLGNIAPYPERSMAYVLSHSSLLTSIKLCVLNPFTV